MKARVAKIKHNKLTIEEQNRFFRRSVLKRIAEINKQVKEETEAYLAGSTPMIRYIEKCADGVKIDRQQDKNRSKGMKAKH